MEGGRITHYWATLYLVRRHCSETNEWNLDGNPSVRGFMCALRSADEKYKWRNAKYNAGKSTSTGCNYPTDFDEGRPISHSLGDYIMRGKFTKSFPEEKPQNHSRLYSD